MSTKVYTSMSPARLLLVDDHPMLRRGISELLSLEDDVEVVGEASNGQEALAFLENNDVDLVILDHKMPVLTVSKLYEKSKPEISIPRPCYSRFQIAARMSKRH